MAEIRPNPGPQEAFLSTPADIAIYGGQAGSGKSFGMIIDPLRHVHRPGFRAIMFRREETRIHGAGSLWEESQGIYPSIGAVSRESPVRLWRWPSGATLEMRHLQHEKDKHAHQGKQYAGIYFDELPEFLESQFWYLISRLRTTCGIRPYVRGSCNPDPDSFVRRLIDWWIGDDGYPMWERSGVLRWFVRDGEGLVWFDSEAEAKERYPEKVPLSLTFIPASLEDNPRGDPSYRAKLDILPLVERERLLGGNWNIRACAGNFFRRSWFLPIDEPPSDVVRWVRAWDLAATEPHEGNSDPDWTRGAKVGLRPNGHLVIADMVSERGSPGTVEALMRTTAEQDGRNTTVLIFQDPGQAGKAQVEHIRGALSGYSVESVTATKNKEAYAKIWSPLVEQGRVEVVRGPWNDAFYSEAEAFPEGKHDDQIDAVSRAALKLAGSGSALSFLEAMTGKGGIRGAVGRVA